MDGPVPASESTPTSGRRRWKLWHLAALVAGSALILALQHYSPWTFCAFGLVLMLFSPAILAILAGPRLFRGLLGLFKLPEESFRGLLLRVVLLVILVVVWRPWISLTFDVFKRLCPD
jgi:hypothetical protein